jgi:hypothetical protein
MSNSRYYVIRVHEKLDDNWEDWFEGMSIQVDEEGTTLQGTLDQAALHGMIARVYRLGLQLSAVNEAEPPAATITTTPVITPYENRER